MKHTVFTLTERLLAERKPDNMAIQQAVLLWLTKELSNS